MKAVEKLTTVPVAFTSIGEKVNEIIDANPPLKAGAGINISKSALQTLISIEEQDVTQDRTFYVTAGSGTVANVTVGAINNVYYGGAGAGLANAQISSLANNNKIYIDATVDDAGTVTDLTVSKDSTVPSNTSRHAYTLLAIATVSAGQVSITRVAWNYSQVQKCGTGTVYYWGGFGS